MSPHPDDRETLPERGAERAAVAIDTLLRLIRRTPEAFPGDRIETVLVFLTIAAASARAYFTRDDLDPYDAISDDDRRPISRRAVAESSGLPRETVRRIIAGLIADGRVAEADGGVRTVRAHMTSPAMVTFLTAIVGDLRTAGHRLERHGG